MPVPCQLCSLPFLSLSDTLKGGCSGRLVVAVCLGKWLVWVGKGKASLSPMDLVQLGVLLWASVPASACYALLVCGGGMRCQRIPSPPSRIYTHTLQDRRRGRLVVAEGASNSLLSAAYDS